MSRLTLSLLKNAVTFAEDSLSNAIVAEENPLRWKFAILSLVQAIELSLKELLRIQHPVLIYSNVDKPGKTVSINQARERLNKIANIKFSKEENSALNTAIDARNKIVHHEVDISTSKLKLVYGRLLAFINEFHRNHFEDSLQNQCDEELWLEGSKIKQYGEELFKIAEVRLKEQGLDDFGYIVTCPECGWDALPAAGENEQTCYVCGKFTDLIFCERCHKVMLYDDDHEYGEQGDYYYCNECLDYITHDYWYESTHGK